MRLKLGGRQPMSKPKAFTLVEILVATALIAFMGSGLIMTILMARHMAEYDKQRMAAVAAARKYIEDSRKKPFPAEISRQGVRLDDFNTPELLDDLNADLDLNLYLINPDGSRGAKISNTIGLNDSDLVEVEVVVEWNRTARLSSHRVSERLYTYRMADLPGSSH